MKLRTAIKKLKAIYDQNLFGDEFDGILLSKDGEISLQFSTEGGTTEMTIEDFEKRSQIRRILESIEL